MECDCLVGHQLANRKQWSKYPSSNSYCDNYFCYQIIGAKKCMYTSLFSEALGSNDELPPTGRQSIMGTMRLRHPLNCTCITEAGEHYIYGVDMWGYGLWIDMVAGC